MKIENRNANPIEGIKAEIAILEKEIERRHADNIAYMSMDPQNREAAKEEFRFERLATGRIELLKKRIDEHIQEERKPEIERRASLIRKAADDLVLLAQAEMEKANEAMQKIEDARKEFNIYSFGLGADTFSDIFSVINGTGKTLGQLIDCIKIVIPQELPGFPEKAASAARYALGNNLPEIRTPEQVKKDEEESKKRIEEAWAMVARRRA